MRSLLCLVLAAPSLLNGGSLLDFSFGVLEQERGHEKEAAEFILKAYQADPIAMPLVRRFVAMKMAANDRPGALAAFEKVLEARSDDLSIRVEYGDFLGAVSRGDALAERKREQTYLKVLEAMPGQYLPIERLIRQARERGEDHRARELLEQLDTGSSADAVRYYAATTRSLYDSKDEAAQKRISEVFGKAAEEHPEWGDIARAGSDYFREMGDMEKAIDILRRHVEVRPSSIDLRIRFGILHFAAGKNDEGIRILKQVLAIHPQKSLALEALAKHYGNKGMTDEVRYYSAELLKIRGGTSEEFVKLAEEFLAADKVREARLLLEKAVFDFPEDAALMMKLAMATTRDPETKDSAARLSRAAENMLANPADAEPAFLLESAKELLAQGETEAAEERLRNAIRTFPKEAKHETAAALRALAGIWISEGRNVDAAKSLISRAEALEK